MLTSKGLSLGQFAHEKKSNDPPIDTSHMSPDEQALLDRPISDLNLSVRARKCMARLQLNTIGEPITLFAELGQFNLPLLMQPGIVTPGKKSVRTEQGIAGKIRNHEDRQRRRSGRSQDIGEIA